MSGDGPLRAADRPSFETILDEQRTAWDGGDRPPIADILARYPFLHADAETVIDLIYHEFVIRRRMGEAPLAEEYLLRFPAWSDALARQFVVDEAMQSVASAPVSPSDEITTVEGSDSQRPVSRPATLPRTIDRHEIIRELGRGGMGIVYLALDPALGRQVAIKTMGEANAAAPSQLRRFLAEAEVIAQLFHPNIIPIYSVGEHQGRPYFSLEFAEGGSLADRLTSGPLPSRHAADLVQTLARAVHAAHRAGIVHRDLKPSNVLFHLDGTPKVADFGLAKLLGDDSSRTLSGEILGTPSYMAPEQAEGHSHEVGPAADIYALGAILYQAMTGRPPFLGASTMETLRLVVSAEVVPPRYQRPDVPRDLETIALKCLEKEPRRRYADAQALADDLRRFLEDRPIAARPVGALGRLWRWCRRNPPLAVSAAALLSTFLLGTPALSILWLQARTERAHAERDRDRAERSRDRAIGAVNALLRVEDDEMLVEELRSYRKALIDAGIREAMALIRDLEGDPRAEHQRLEAEMALARIQFDAGDRAAAVETTHRTIAQAEALYARDPSNPRVRNTLAEVFHRAATILPDETERRSASDRSVEILVSNSEGTASFAHAASMSMAAMNHYNTALLHWEKGRLDEVIASLLAARGAIDEATAKGDHSPKTIAMDGRIRLFLCRAYGFAHRDEAFDAGRQAESILASLVRDHPEPFEFGQQLSLAQEELALRLMGTERWDEAIATLERARRTLKDMAARHGKLVSRMVTVQGSLARVDLNLRNAYQSDLSRHIGAFREIVAEAHEICDKLDLVQEPGLNLRTVHAITAYDLAELQAEDGQRPNLGLILESERLWTAMLREQPGEAFTSAYLVIVRRRLAEELADLGRLDEAATWSRRSLETVRGRPEIGYTVAADAASNAGNTGTYPTKLDARQLGERRRRFVATATAMLRQAIADGFHDAARLRQDPAFNPIRPDPEFAAILADLEFPADPFKP